MIASLEKAPQVESEFLTAVQRNIRIRPVWLPGRLSARVIESNERERLRAMMMSRQMYDLNLLDRLPQNRSVTFRSYIRPWYGLGRRQAAAVTASVVCSLSRCLDAGSRDASQDPSTLPPIDRTELEEHLARYVANRPITQVLGVCSPSGFTHEARTTAFSRPGLSVVLTEPLPGGGWRTTPICGDLREAARELFDPESRPQKLARVQQALRCSRPTLLYQGVSAAEVAEAQGVAPSIVEEAFAQLANEDRRYHVTRNDRTSILFRTTTATKEAQPMSILEFFRRLLGRQATPDEQIRDLRAKQAEIDEERRNLEKALDELVTQESQLLKEGASADALSVKRRLASRVAQIRQEIALQNEKVGILSKQSQILGRQVHNLEVVQTARPSGLPASEEITEAAAAAESALEELEGAYETVRTVNRATSDQAVTPEEADILAEFEAQAAKLKSSAAGQTSPTDVAPAKEATAQVKPKQREPEAD